MLFIGDASFSDIRKNYVNILSSNGRIVKSLPYKGNHEGAMVKKELIGEDLDNMTKAEFEEKYEIG